MYGSGQVRIVNRWLVIKPRLNSGILTTGGWLMLIVTGSRVYLYARKS